MRKNYRYRIGGKLLKLQDGGYTVSKSNRKGKTHKVTGPDGTIKHFGDPNLKNKPKNKEAKKSFYARHKKNLKNNPHFKAYAKATWEKGGYLPELVDLSPYENGGELPQLFSALAKGGYLKDKNTYVTKDGKETRRGLWANVYLKKKRKKRK